MAETGIQQDRGECELLTGVSDEESLRRVITRCMQLLGVGVLDETLLMQKQCSSYGSRQQGENNSNF